MGTPLKSSEFENALYSNKTRPFDMGAITVSQ